MGPPLGLIGPKLLKDIVFQKSNTVSDIHFHIYGASPLRTPGEHLKINISFLFLTHFLGLNSSLFVLEMFKSILIPDAEQI